MDPKRKSLIDSHLDGNKLRKHGLSVFTPSVSVSCSHVPSLCYITQRALWNMLPVGVARRHEHSLLLFFLLRSEFAPSKPQSIQDTRTMRFHSDLSALVTFSYVDNAEYVHGKLVRVVWLRAKLQSLDVPLIQCAEG